MKRLRDHTVFKLIIVTSVLNFVKERQAWVSPDPPLFPFLHLQFFFSETSNTILKLVQGNKSKKFLILPGYNLNSLLLQFKKLFFLFLLNLSSYVNPLQRDMSDKIDDQFFHYQGTSKQFYVKVFLLPSQHTAPL
jgi:hypothetical protein